MIVENVSLATIAALSRVKCDDRAALEGTSFAGSEAILVTYDMKCGKGYTRRSHPSVPWKDVALAALSKVNDETMTKILRQALSDREELEKEHKLKVTKAFQSLVDKHEVEVRAGSVQQGEDLYFHAWITLEHPQRSEPTEHPKDFAVVYPEASPLHCHRHYC